MTQPKVQLPRDGPSLAPQGLCFVPGAGGPSRLHPQTFETPEGSEPGGGARPRSPAERRPAPAGCAAPPASSGTHFLVSGRPIFRQLLESVSAPGQRFRRPGCQGCPAVSRGSSPGRLRACAAGRRPAPRVAA